jgi:hypothetical protein
MFGGAVPDALMVLARLLSTLHDDVGEVAVDGLIGREGPASTTPRTGSGTRPASSTETG